MLLRSPTHNVCLIKDHLFMYQDRLWNCPKAVFWATSPKRPLFNSSRGFLIHDFFRMLVNRMIHSRSGGTWRSRGCTISSKGNVGYLLCAGNTDMAADIFILLHSVQLPDGDANSDLTFAVKFILGNSQTCNFSWICPKRSCINMRFKQKTTNLNVITLNICEVN